MGERIPPQRHRLEWEGYIDSCGWHPPWGALTERLQRELEVFLPPRSVEKLRGFGNEYEAVWAQPNLGKVVAQEIGRVREAIASARRQYQEAGTELEFEEQTRLYGERGKHVEYMACRYVNRYEIKPPAFVDEEPDKLAPLMTNPTRRLAVLLQKPTEHLPREAYFVANMLIHEKNPHRNDYKPDRRHSDFTVSDALKRRVGEIIDITEGIARTYLINEGFRLPKRKISTLKIIGGIG